MSRKNEGTIANSAATKKNHYSDVSDKNRKKIIPSSESSQRIMGSISIIVTSSPPSHAEVILNIVRALSHSHLTS